MSNNGNMHFSRTTDGYKVKLQVLGETDALRLESVLSTHLVQVLSQQSALVDTADGYLRSHNLALRLRHNHLQFPLAAAHPHEYVLTLSPYLLDDSCTARLNEEGWSQEWYTEALAQGPLALPQESPLLQKLFAEHPQIRSQLVVHDTYVTLRKTYSWTRLLLEFDKYTFSFGVGYQLQFRPPNSSVESTSKVLKFLQQNHVNTAASNMSKAGLLFCRRIMSVTKAEPCCGGLDPSCPFRKMVDGEHGDDFSSEDHLMQGLLMPSDAMMQPPVASSLSPITDSDSSGGFGESGGGSIEFPNAFTDMEDLGRFFQFSTETSLASAVAPAAIVSESSSSSSSLSSSTSPTFATASAAAVSTTSVSSSSSSSAAAVAAVANSSNALFLSTNGAATAPAALKHPMAATTTSAFPSPKQLQPAHFSPSKSSKPLVEKPGLTPEAVAMLQKKRSCEASARYRRKKQSEQDVLRKRVMELTEENQRLQRDFLNEQQRCRILQAQLDVVLNGSHQHHHQHNSSNGSSNNSNNNHIISNSSAAPTPGSAPAAAAAAAAALHPPPPTSYSS